MQLYDCIEGADIRLLDFVDYILLMRNLGSKKIAWRKLSINIEDMENYIHEYNIDKYENLDIYQLDKISINEIRKKFYQIINQKIENFINLNRDSKYEFSVCKYLCNSNKIVVESDGNSHLVLNIYFINISKVEIVESCPDHTVYLGEPALILSP